ncbi:MBL fold metallo-hydrolase, partial [bacterium]|nr:MBL fold metallo-hydrolase [bacterium]
MFSYSRTGIRITNSDLFLDAEKEVDFSFVSHSHLDHARKHKSILATGPTIQFFKMRVGSTKTTELEYHTPYYLEECSVTLYPAGHILGSAQAIVEKDGIRLLYSGDFNTKRSLTVEAIEIPSSDILIMECTFGKPFYRFPPRELMEERLLEFVRHSLGCGATPVVIGYALGKAHEAMRILGQAGFQMSVHGTIARLARVYEDYGFQLGRWDRYKRDELDGRALIVPPRALRTRMVQRISNKRTVLLTGWAMHPGTKFRR